MKTTISKFGEPVTKLTVDQQIRFYELFAHGLTIGVREVWSDNEITDAEKVDRMKWINEIMHRIPSKLGQLRNPSYEWKNKHFEQMVQGWVERNPNIRTIVNYAINDSFKVVTNMS